MQNLEVVEIAEQEDEESEEAPFEEDTHNFNDYYDSEEAEDDMGDGHSPINLPDAYAAGVDEEDDDQIAQEQIYSICGSGKRTTIHGTELYGFFLWILTSLLFIAYLVWCYVPTAVLNSWGVHYIPNKYYALALPTWIGTTAMIIIQLYCALGMIHCHPNDSFKSMQDYATILSHPKDQDPQAEPTTESQHMGSPHARPLKKAPSVLVGSSTNHGHSVTRTKKAPKLVATHSSTALGRKARVETLGKSAGRRHEEQLNINYFAKIPDIVELPITVVNNVLYSHHWKQD